MQTVVKVPFWSERVCAEWVGAHSPSRPAFVCSLSADVDDVEPHVPGIPFILMGNHLPVITVQKLTAIVIWMRPDSDSPPSRSPAADMEQGIWRKLHANEPRYNFRETRHDAPFVNP
jgi:hypothetical protein